MKAPSRRPEARQEFSGQQVLKDLFLRSPVPVALVDPRSRRIAAANRAFAELLSYSPADLRDVPFAALDRASSAEVEEHLLLATTVQDDRPHRRTLVAGNGSQVEVEYQARLVGAEGGSLLAIFMRDVRQERQAEQDRVRLQKQLWMAQKHEAVGRLAAGIAHDFNNLMATVMLTVDALRERLAPLDEVSATDLDVITSASEQARNLTRELLAFSGKQVLRPRPVSMNDVVTAMEGLVRRTLPADIELAVRRSDGPAVVSADLAQMQQVVLNLVVNARDAMPGGGHLVIQVHEVELDEDFARDYASIQPGPHVLLSVTDTGIGMDEETRSRIFEPFFSTRERGGGTGLGLATVYGIVKQSGGSIWVTSEPGVGTTFRIYFPRISGAWVGQEIERIDTIPRGQEHVLIVEDDATVRSTAARILRELGYEVTEAESPDRAIEIHEQVWPERGPHPITMLLTDVVMPGMSGVELARRLREKREDLPILYMSGYLEPMHDQNTRSVPIEPRLSKPFTRGELAHGVRDVLDGRSGR